MTRIIKKKLLFILLTAFLHNSLFSNTEITISHENQIAYILQLIFIFKCRNSELKQIGLHNEQSNK